MWHILLLPQQCYTKVPQCYVLRTLPSCFFFVAPQPHSCVGSLTVEASRSHTNTHAHTRTHTHTHAHTHKHARAHTHTHTEPVGLLWRIDQFVAEAATYTTQTKHNRRKPMPLPEFSPAFPSAIKRLQTYALARTATWVGTYHLKRHITNQFLPRSEQTPSSLLRSIT
jgi:hypothetical protein